LSIRPNSKPPPEYYTDGLKDLAKGKKVTWDRIVYVLTDLLADTDDLKEVYRYMLEDDRVEMIGFDDVSAVMTWQAQSYHQDIADDIVTFLAKRRLQKPAEPDEEHY